MISVKEESVRNEAHVDLKIDQGKGDKFSCIKRKAFGLTHALLLLLSVSPFICGTLFILVGNEEEIDAYIYFDENKTPYLNATLISSRDSTNNFTKIGPAVLRPYILPDDKGPSESEIVAFTMNLSWTESELDMENRLRDARAVIIYEEIGFERPSSPLPHKLVKLFAKQHKWAVVRVKHWPKIISKNQAVTEIVFKKDQT